MAVAASRSGEAMGPMGHMGLMFHPHKSHVSHRSHSIACRTCTVSPRDARTPTHHTVLAASSSGRYRPPESFLRAAVDPRVASSACAYRCRIRRRQTEAFLEITAPFAVLHLEQTAAY